MTNPLTPEARRAWMKVIVLLNMAADRVAVQASDDPGGGGSVAVFAQIIASQAVALLLAEFAHELDDIDIGDDLAHADFVALVRAAARRYPIEQFPVGASEVTVELGGPDVRGRGMSEHRPTSGRPQEQHCRCAQRQRAAHGGRLSARQMMWDPNPDTAKLKAAIWVELAEVANELWSAIPTAPLIPP